MSKKQLMKIKKTMIKIATKFTLFLILQVSANFVIAQNKTDSLGRKQGRWMLEYNELDSNILCYGIRYFGYDSLYINISRDFIHTKLLSFGEKDPNVQQPGTITICNFINDTLNGDFAVYFNGVRIYEVTIVNGRLHGIARLYSKKGKLYRIDQYINGKITLINVFSKGKIVECLVYNGKASQTGTFFTFRKSGKIKYSIEYKNANIHGKETFYWRNGNPKLEYIYINDKMISSVTYSRSGKVNNSTLTTTTHTNRLL